MLTIYRASAGSGKTHKLTGEYLTLLFSQPYAYRRILAVTFTNKATSEMKHRVVTELYKIASGRPSDYLTALTSTYSLTEKQLQKRARKILITLLHDYSAFNISTIDRFFQQVIRAFAHEIGLQGGYEIVMDEKLVLNKAVDRMMTGLGKPESKTLLKWLLRFAEHKIEEGSSWNLRKDILSLSQELFKERYKTFSEDVRKNIADKQTLETYRSKLYSIIHSVESEAKKMGEEGLALMRRFDLEPSDFKGGSRSPLFFFEQLAKGTIKAPTQTFNNLADSPENYASKSAPKAKAISQAYENGLNNLVKKVIDFFSHITNYYTAREITHYYYTLGILTDVSHQIAEYREDKNVMLIADTTELLNKVIKGSDAPFIYEKTGTQVDHYMIDEFQDTSNMQWENFLPLVRESLAHGHDNLIVGDVKQSIYRFRNSDWKLLDEQVRQDFHPKEVREETLKENWRSNRLIVEFNNALFSIAPTLIQEQYNKKLYTSSLKKEDQESLSKKIEKAYDTCFQQVPKSFQQKSGHVRIDFLTSDEEMSWKQRALDQLPKILEQLQDKGYELKDIAILTRRKNEGTRVADALLSYKESHPSERYRYEVLSDEALFICNSSAVRFLVNVLRYLGNPENQTKQALAGHAHQILVGKFGEAVPEEVFQSLRSLSRQSLYEIIESLFRLFADRFPDTEQVFIQAFLDMVMEYAQKESPDINRFLTWWDETGSQKTIATPDGQNAVRILTIHKSKGLGFKVVIIPFCDWKIDHSKTEILWCHPDQEPFNDLNLVPIQYKTSLADTFFARDYFEEQSRTFIDSLNTLYVSFTRAKEELIVLAPRPTKEPDKKGRDISFIANLLWETLQTRKTHTCKGDPLFVLPDYFRPDENVFEMGKDWKPTADETKEKGIEEIAISRLHSIAPDNRLRLRLQGKGFSFDNSRRKQGTLMHEILSRIRTLEDIPAAVRSYQSAGVIQHEEAEALVIRLEELLRTPEVASWYDGTAHVLNEVDILFGEGLSKRPDRILIQGDTVTVVDYKFGERQDTQHQQQVKEYLSLVRSMGYPSVQGYLWYVELKEIVPVNL